MGNDRDDKFEGHEESEYHFSDEEANYEVEAEVSKPTSEASVEKKENILSRLTGSKRMLISVAVFLVLVFVVYKMVAPSSSVPSTDISAAPAVVQQNPMPAKNQAPAYAAPNQVAPAAPTPAVAAAPVVPPVPGAMASYPATAAPAVNQPGMAAVSPQVPASTVPQPGMAPVTATAPATMNMAPSGAALTSAPPSATGMVQQQPVVQQPMMQAPFAQPAVTAQQQQMVQPGVVSSQPQQVVTNMPAVIPVQTPVPTTYVNQAPATVSLDQQTAVLNTDVDRAMAQLQSNYAQKFNDYSNQTKALEEQVQTLNSKVANMENQLNQLVQILTRQQGLLNNSAASPVQPQIAELPKVAYNVQAIIPGRAWLKSDTGETLTVAEGDVIRDVGRVTKIDPYDGLVEINTGNKVISLAYGNGG